ncbi:SDR family NAD(P)-dependent oxidoreductase [Streptomycetaceae bacterium NBC_01309]
MPSRRTSSVNGLRGNRTLIDYSATKGAVLALTYALSQSLRERGIRVNCWPRARSGRR